MDWIMCPSKIETTLLILGLHLGCFAARWRIGRYLVPRDRAIGLQIKVALTLRIWLVKLQPPPSPVRSTNAPRPIPGQPITHAIPIRIHGGPRGSWQMETALLPPRRRGYPSTKKDAVSRFCAGGTHTRCWSDDFLSTNQINRLLNNKFGSNLRPQIAGNTEYIIFCPRLGHSEELSLKKSELSSLPKS